MMNWRRHKIKQERSILRDYQAISLRKYRNSTKIITLHQQN
jgi:hypothetical protein